MCWSPPVAASAVREQFLVAQAQHWGIKVHRNFESVEVRIVFPCGEMQNKQDLETITPQGILLAQEQLLQRRTCALATFPFAQQIPISQARRYLSRDTGCLVLDDNGDGSVSLVQANVVDLNDGWYEGSKKVIVEGGDDLNAALLSALGPDAWQTVSIDPQAIRHLRNLAKKMFGEMADEQPVMICARQYQSQGLVFVGQSEDIHLFLRSEAVRKEFGITDWTQRGYTAPDRKLSYFNLWPRDIEVELGAWDEMITMYRDCDARTLTTVQPLSQFKRERQLGDEILDATGCLADGNCQASGCAKPAQHTLVGMLLMIMMVLVVLATMVVNKKHEVMPVQVNTKCRSAIGPMNSNLPLQAGIVRLFTIRGQRPEKAEGGVIRGLAGATASNLHVLAAQVAISQKTHHQRCAKFYSQSRQQRSLEKNYCEEMLDL